MRRDGLKFYCIQLQNKPHKLCRLEVLHLANIFHFKAIFYLLLASHISFSCYANTINTKGSWSLFLCSYAVVFLQTYSLFFISITVKFVISAAVLSGFIFDTFLFEAHPSCETWALCHVTSFFFPRKDWKPTEGKKPKSSVRIALTWLDIVSQSAVLVHANFGQIHYDAFFSYST